MTAYSEPSISLRAASDCPRSRCPGEIIVSDHKDYRTLRFDGICEQSKMSLSNPAQPIHNYIKAMLMAVARQPPTSALITGLGGGGLLRALHALDPTMRPTWSSCAPR